MLKIQNNPILVSNFIDEYLDIVLKRLNRVINSGLSATQKRKKITLSANEKKVLEKFNNKRAIKFLISANPIMQKKIIRYISKKYPHFHNKNSNAYKILQNVFLSHGYDKIDKYKFIKNIGLKSCAYCNRAYIFTINKNKNLKPEIDHFYPKHIYPYLGMSYYNLIPSCPTCNGFGAKGTRDSFKDKLKNPYEIKCDDFKFTFNIKSVNILNNKIDEKSIDIKLITNETANDDYFQLNNLYQENKDIIIELYQKLYQENTKEHFQKLSKSLKGIEFDENEIHKLITGGYKDDNDLHKRPLSKLIKDISEELKLV